MPDYIYDQQSGNMVEDDLHKYKYDGLDRLTRVEKKNGDLVAEYTYDNGGVPAEIQTRKDASGVVETFQYSSEYYRGIRIYQGDQLKESYHFLPDDEYSEIIAVIEKKKPDGSVDVYVAELDPRKNIALIFRIESDDIHDRTLVQRYEYTPGGALTVYDRNGHVIQEPPISRFLFRGALHDQSTGFYFIANRFYSPKTGMFVSPDYSLKWQVQNCDYAALYSLPLDPVQQEEEKMVQERLNAKKQRDVVRQRRIEIDRINQHWYTRFVSYCEGSGRAFLSLLTETVWMVFDISGSKQFNGQSWSAVGRARDMGMSWGDIGKGAVVGIVHLPERWCEKAWEGDMQGIGTVTTEILLVVDAPVSLYRAARGSRVVNPNIVRVVDEVPALGRAVPIGHPGGELAMLEVWEAMIWAEKMSRRPHLTRNPIRVIANRSEQFAMDIYNMAAHVGGNPAMPRTMLFMSRGRHQPLLKPWDLTQKVGDSTLLELLHDRLPPWLLTKLEKHGTQMRTVGDVDEVLRALWAYEREMAGTGFAAGHRADLAINLIQTNFENRMGLAIIEGYARGNETMAQVISNLFVPQWGASNSAMGGGLTASLSNGLPRWYGIRLPEGTPIRLVGVQRRAGRGARK